MTELLSRPPATASARSYRPVQVAAMLAALTAVAIGLGICMAVAVIGWFVADAGAHGNTTDALRAGADAWLIAHGSASVVAGTPVGILPLGLTLMMLVIGFRSGAWSLRDRAGAAHSDKDLAQAVGLAILVYVMALVVIAILSTNETTDPSLPRAVVGGGIVCLLGVGTALAWRTGRFAHWWGRVPLFARVTVEGAATAALLCVAAGALVVFGALLWSFNDASMLFSSLRLGGGDALMLTVVTALFAPNAALFGTAWLAGPGFAVGAGTAVSPTDVSLGALPNFPLLAALPEPTTVMPSAVAIVMGVPVLLAAIAAGRAQHRYGVRAWDSSALRGFAVGFGAALLLTVLMTVAGGPLGTGRMSVIGPDVAEVFVLTMGGMSIGGLVGGLLVTTWQRLRDRREQRSHAG